MGLEIDVWISGRLEDTLGRFKDCRRRCLPVFGELRTFYIPFARRLFSRPSTTPSGIGTAHQCRTSSNPRPERGRGCNGGGGGCPGGTTRSQELASEHTKCCKPPSTQFTGPHTSRETCSTSERITHRGDMHPGIDIYVRNHVYMYIYIFARWCMRRGRNNGPRMRRRKRRSP